MSRREGEAQRGRWVAYSDASTVYVEQDRYAQLMTPAQARALARALMELADEVDPDGAGVTALGLGIMLEEVQGGEDSAEVISLLRQALKGEHWAKGDDPVVDALFVAIVGGAA